MDEKQLISVVIPTHNRKSSLKDCLDSVLSQYYPSGEYEVIVVDDGSTDGTKRFLKEFTKTNSNVKFFSQPNRGPSAARNLGIEKSSGGIICFIDDDCIPEKDWLKNLVKGFDCEKVGGVGGKIITNKPSTLTQRYVEESGILNQEGFGSRKLLITGNVAYKRDALIKSGGFDTSLNACEDIDLSIRVQLLGYGIKYVDNAIVYHEYRPSIIGLYRQQYRNAKGYARLNKKYPMYFSPLYNLISYSYRLVGKIISYPFFLLSTLLRKGKDKKYYAIKPLLDALVLTAFVIGMITEPLLGKKYSRWEKEGKISFLKEQSFKTFLNKLFDKNKY